MMESFFRAHGSRLQSIYDRLPAPVQHAATSARGWILTRNRYNTEARQLLEQYRVHEQWKPEQIHDYQLHALNGILDHARRTVPFYAGYPVGELRRLEDLTQFPVLGRESVRSAGEDLISRQSSAAGRITAGTTGTTGAALRVSYTAAVTRRVWALNLRQWAWAGLAPRTPRLTLFGSRVAPPARTSPPYWSYNVPERQILLSIFHLSDRTAGDYCSFLQQHSGRVLEGFPSALGILADLMLSRGIRVPMRAVFSTGEPLYPHLRARMEEAFATRVWDSYGMTELCGQIHECEQGRMHLAPESGHLEVLDEENRPVSGESEGFLVWTGFLNRTMPLIRYRVGDRGHWDTGGECSCGRSFPLVTPGITRQSDLLTTPDGRVFSPRALNQSLKHTRLFRFCQIVHEASDRVQVRAVSREAGAGEELVRVCAELQRILGADITVYGRLEDAPIVRAGGKIPLIVQAVRH